MNRVFVHIVTWNSASSLDACLSSLRDQNAPIHLEITDNASSDQTFEILKRHGIAHNLNPTNFGFCAAHNQGVARFLKSDCDFLLILNPDTTLRADTLTHLCAALRDNSGTGLATPKLLRMEGETIDAAGMTLTSSLRHFDRGAGEVDSGQYEQMGKVFGGTGACLLLKRACVESLLLTPTHDDLLREVYPQLPAQRGERAELFDENFFAYREDADLSWRAQRLGWDCLYVPHAVARHKRVVTPERRSQLPAMLNLLGVQNRFLLQINNVSPLSNMSALISGMIIRNLIVLLALPFERTSLLALPRIRTLLPRALAHRREIAARAKRAPAEVMKWLSHDLEEL